MPPNPPIPAPERQKTNESLDLERQKTDDELGKSRAAIEERSDAAVDEARGRADEVLEGARDLADETLDREGSSKSHREMLRDQRVQEDAAVRDARETADEKVVDERERRTRALANLLRLERDHTDEQLLVERARSDAALATRDDFMGMVCHDLRSLLSGIALNAANQVKNATDDEAGLRNLKAAKGIQRVSARMNRLIGDLVDVASIEAGRLAIAPRRCDANAVLRDAVEAFQPAASLKGIVLKAALSDRPLLTTFDDERILQVLANLVSNAIKFTDQGGEISLEVGSAAAEVRFSVVDTGPGIASVDQDVIFERFWQVAPGDRRGLGLGLFISKCIVDAHGGRIWVESVVGEGSRFCFTLPAGQTSA